MILALSTLCENPRRKTGLTTMFHEFVGHSASLFPDVSWIVFADPEFVWTVEHPNVQVNRTFTGNSSLVRRLFADHVRLPRLARSLGASALVTCGFVPLVKALPTAMHMNVLTHVSGNDQLGLLRRLYRYLMMAHGFRNADLIISNSGWASNEILKIAPGCRDRLTVSYEGLQHDIFQPEPAGGEIENLAGQFGIAPGYFLWVSNFYAYKQADLMLKAYAQLEPEMRRVHPLVMAGGSHGGAAAAQTLAAELGIQDDVRFLGWISDEWLAPLYRQAGAHCFASREETFGRSVIEAMACGTPSVLNDIPIMREVSGGHAILVDFRQTEQVAAALSAVMNDQPLRHQLRENGIRRAAHFHFDALAAERISAIRQTLERKRKGKPLANSSVARDGVRGR